MIYLTTELMRSRGIPKEHQKVGEFIPQNGEQGNMGSGNKKEEYTGNSRVF